MSRTRYRIYDDHYPHFLTSTVVAWLPLFSQPTLVEIVFESWRFLMRKRGVEILSYVILENHLHWIAVGDELSKRVSEFKSFTARQIIDTSQSAGHSTLLAELEHFKLRHKVGQTYQVWQEGSHPQQIDNDEMMWQKIEYIHNNPVRRGYVADPLHWRYSSAANYAGQPGLIDVVTDWR